MMFKSYSCSDCVAVVIVHEWVIEIHSSDSVRHNEIFDDFLAHCVVCIFFHIARIQRASRQYVLCKNDQQITYSGHNMLIEFNYLICFNK